MITIVDYGLGNLASIQNILKKVGANATISSNKEDILKAEKLILPGVGAFKRGMENLRQLNLIEPLNQAVLVQKTPVLGICLGMQLMTNHSEEGNVEGLKWIDANVKKFSSTQNILKIPNMGWNEVDFSADSLFHNIYHEPIPRFYFVHSYYVDCKHQSDVIGTSNYGHQYVSAFQRGNIIGMQFHPEKSHIFGMSIIKAFLKI